MRYVSLCVVLMLSIGLLHAQSSFKKAFTAMGCGFEVTVVASDQDVADAYLSSAIDNIRRIELLISSWKADSQTGQINSSAGIEPVAVDIELYDLIKRSIGLSKLTNGAFDITYASMDKIWKFDGTVTQFPENQMISESVSRVGFQKIETNDSKHSVFLPEKGMKIGFGAIGKGYAADHTMKLLQSQGVSAGIINASGDLRTWGTQPDGKPWRIGIKNPLNNNKIFTMISLKDQALVTSGNYEKYILIDGKRYSHIIDPRTGVPSSGLTSVTIIASSAELADALATSVFVMGKDVGLDFVNQIKGVECILVEDDGSVSYSDHVNANQIN